MALEKPERLREFFSPTLWPPWNMLFLPVLSVLLMNIKCGWYCMGIYVSLYIVH